MQLRARFIGEDGWLGYQKGKVYTITLVDNWLQGLNAHFYETIPDFLNDWMPLKPGD